MSYYLLIASVMPCLVYGSLIQGTSFGSGGRLQFQSMGFGSGAQQSFSFPGAVSIQSQGQSQGPGGVVQQSFSSPGAVGMQSQSQGSGGVVQQSFSSPGVVGMQSQSQGSGGVVQQSFSIPDATVVHLAQVPTGGVAQHAVLNQPNYGTVDNKHSAYVASQTPNNQAGSVVPHQSGTLIVPQVLNVKFDTDPQNLEGELCRQLTDTSVRAASSGTGLVYFFTANKYYVYREQPNTFALRYVRQGSQSEFNGGTLGTIDNVFHIQNQYYLLYGQNVRVYNERWEFIEEIPFAMFYRIHPHIVARKNGIMTAFFIPPDAVEIRRGPVTHWQSYQYNLGVYGKASLATQVYGNDFDIKYNGWTLPAEFQSYYQSANGYLIFLRGNKFAKVDPNCKEPLYWMPLEILFECGRPRLMSISTVAAQEFGK